MTVMPTKPRVPPRWKVVRDKLQAELPAYSYGSDFYSIAEVCRKFDVSQITAIRALNELASRHLIEKISGKGNVVRRVPRPASIWMLTPAKAQRKYLVFDSALQRRVKGITTAATQQNVDFDTISESHLQDLFPRRGESFGFLVHGPVARQTCEFLRQRRLPYVLVDPPEQFKGRPHARINRVHAGYLAARYLLDLGHRRIAWITGPVNQRNFRDRLRGYRQALGEAGIPFRWSLIKETESAEADRVQAMLEELLDLRRPPTAVIAGDDSRAIHMLEACRQRGIAVPGQLSILGYPNYPESRVTHPPLSVIDAPFEKVGEAAVKLLLEQMLQGAAPAKQAVLIEPELVERGSTGPAMKRQASS